MIHFGDITKINGAEVPVVDIICGGSPCQDLSYAGKRQGIKHFGLGDDEVTRSGLFMEQIRIIKEMRQQDESNGRAAHLCRPRFCIWENVPGAFSSNGGKDFQAVLTEFVRIIEPDAPDVPMPENGRWPKAGCLYGVDRNWSISFRLHDAQFWGVPQRRKRIALVADFGGLAAPEVLFERKGLSWDTEPGGETRKGASSDAEDGAGDASYTLKIRGGVERDSAGKAAGKGPLIQTELSATLGVSQDQTQIQPAAVDVYNQGVTGEVAASLTAAAGGTNTSGPKVMAAGFSFGQSAKARSLGYEEELSPTLRGGEGGNQKPCICVDMGGGKTQCGVSIEQTPTLATTHGGEPVVFGISPLSSYAMMSENPHSGIYKADTSRTLDNNGGNPACNQGGMIVLTERK